MIEDALARMLTTSSLDLGRLTSARIGTGLVAIAATGVVAGLATSYHPQTFRVSFPTFESGPSTPVEVAVVPATALAAHPVPTPPAPAAGTQPAPPSARTPVAAPAAGSEPTAAAPVPRPIAAVRASPIATSAPSDRRALIVQLQRSLASAGCYDGHASGAWTSPSRRAMQAFLAEVNATLPVDRPDPALLSLIESNPNAACRTDAAAVPATPSVVQRETSLASATKASDEAPAATPVPEHADPPPRGFAPVTPSEPVAAGSPGNHRASARAQADVQRIHKKRSGASSPGKIAKKFLRNLDRALSGAF